ncbi:MAG: hypothetical protein AAF488_14955, partial [Planctomycetota bacterium]
MAVATSNQLTSAGIKNAQEVIRLLAEGGLTNDQYVALRKLLEEQEQLDTGSSEAKDVKKVLSLNVTSPEPTLSPDTKKALEKILARKKLTANEIYKAAEDLRRLKSKRRSVEVKAKSAQNRFKNEFSKFQSDFGKLRSGETAGDPVETSDKFDPKRIQDLIKDADETSRQKLEEA